MQGKEGLLYPLNLHSLKELPAEMQTCSRCCNRTVVLCKDCMEPLQIYRLRSLSNPLWHRNATYTKECLPKLIVRAVIEKTQCSAAGCGIVNNLCHKRIILSKIEFVSNSNLSCRVHKNIPKALLAVELPKKEYLYIRTCLLLIAVQACRKDFGIVKHKEVALICVINNILKNLVLYLATLLMQNHKTALIPIFGRVFCNTLHTEGKIELR